MTKFEPVQSQRSITIGLDLLIFIVLVAAGTACHTTRSALEIEAGEKFEEFTSKYVTDCGKYQTTGRFTIPIQTTELVFVPKTEALTEADRLNGIEWRTTISSSCTSYRNAGSSQWLSCSRLPTAAGLGLIRMEKTRGKWNIDDIGFSKTICFDWD